MSNKISRTRSAFIEDIFSAGEILDEIYIQFRCHRVSWNCKFESGKFSRRVILEGAAKYPRKASQTIDRHEESLLTALEVVQDCPASSLLKDLKDFEAIGRGYYCASDENEDLDLVHISIYLDREPFNEAAALVGKFELNNSTILRVKLVIKRNDTSTSHFLVSGYELFLNPGESPSGFELKY